MRPLAVLVALAAVAVAVVLPPRSGSTGAKAPPKPCKPTAGFGAKVGIVLEAHGMVQQGKDRLRKGTVLRRNATVCTGTRGSANSGTVKFVVDKLKKTTCEMSAGSRLRLLPKSPRPVVIRFEEGRTYCATAKDSTGKERLFEGHNGWVRMFVKDPLFSLVGTGRRNTVKVKLGSVKVGGRTGAAVIVGPGQQSTVPATGPAQEPVPLVETPEDRKMFGQLKAAVPKPDFSRPPATGSRTLLRIFAANRIAIGLASDVPQDPPTRAFLLAFGDFFASSWHMGLRRVEDPTDELAKTLVKHELDMVVTSDPARFKGFQTLPLLADAKDTAWYFVFETDKVFAAALGKFVRTMVDSGKYSALYRDAFGKEPSFDVLKPVLFG